MPNVPIKTYILNFCFLMVFSINFSNMGLKFSSSFVGTYGIIWMLQLGASIEVILSHWLVHGIILTIVLYFSMWQISSRHAVHRGGLDGGPQSMVEITLDFFLYHYKSQHKFWQNLGALDFDEDQLNIKQCSPLIYLSQQKEAWHMVKSSTF